MVSELVELEFQQFRARSESGFLDLRGREKDRGGHERCVSVVEAAGRTVVGRRSHSGHGTAGSCACCFGSGEDDRRDRGRGKE